jgi:hypothetical protein
MKFAFLRERSNRFDASDVRRISRVERENYRSGCLTAPCGRLYSGRIFRCVERKADTSRGTPCSLALL